MEESPYWKTIFQTCAYGQFPQNMTYKDGILYYRKARRKQPITYPISSDPEKASNELKEILRKEKNLISVDELTEKRIRAKKKLREITLPVDTEWNNISGSLARRLILSNYVHEMKIKLHLSEDEAMQLHACLTVGIAIGAIGNDDITMSRGQILEVKNIVRLQNGFFLTEIPSVPDPKPRPAKNSQTTCSDGWDKYCTAYARSLRGTAL